MFKGNRKPMKTLAVLGVVSAMILLIGWVVTRDQPGVTPRNVAAIRPGMTYAEVETLMGCPSGTLPPDAGDLAIESLPESFVLAPYGRPGAGHHWIGRRAAVFVILDANDRVSEVRPLNVTQLVSKPWWQFW